MVTGRALGPVAAVAGLALLALAGCAGGGGADGAGEEPTEAVVGGASVPPDPREIPTPRQPPPTRSADEACGGDPFDPGAVRAYTPEGPPYAGGGVHPVELFAVGTRPYEEGGPGLPEGWHAVPFNGPAQLVLCEYRDEGYEGATVGTCAYAGGSVDSIHAGGEVEVRAARYTYRLFEARTGELVETFTLPGTTAPEDSCPDSTYYPAAAYYQLVETEALADALRPLVTGAAPG